MSASPVSSNLKEDIKLLEKLFLKKPSGLVSSSTSSQVPSTSKNSSDQVSQSSVKHDASKFNCFRLVSASLDELVCEFVDTSMKKYRITANICVS